MQSSRIEVVDSNGEAIKEGSFVEIVNEKLRTWYGFQGLVVTANSRENPRYGCVAVYFDSEADKCLLDTPELALWDAKWKNLCDQIGFRFISKDPVWKTSPRVIHFMPKELLVRTKNKSLQNA